MEATLIFPHQLFPEHPALKKGRQVFLIEDSLFFGDPNHPAHFHQQKLVFHRASMKAYHKQLKGKGYRVRYIDYDSELTIGHLLKTLLKSKELDLYFTDPTDFILEKRLKRFAEQHGAKLHCYENPGFLTSKSWNQEYFGSRKQRFMASYYKEQRKRLNLLVDDSGKPEGGKWSFDEDNRKALPKNHEPPEEPSSDPSNEVKEAIRYIQKNFPENPGNAEHFWFGTTEKDAWLWFDQFLNQRFKLFGDYEDAVSDDHTVLYHSVLTPYLNAGIISPEAVVERTIEFAEANKIPMNCLEGFIRQIIGWREFMRAMYEQHGVEERTKNYWNFDRPMPTAFYTASTGIDPIDTIIRRVLDRCYCHHIERLMIIGNFMLLCRIRPDDIYRWFMELYIDAYDWVMVPNVYGMSQFADGGIFTTKPYISSSNYVRKMSTFKKGPWCDVWDGLFWSFIKDQEAFFRKHPRLGMMTRQLDKMDPAKLKLHQKNAARFLKQLDAG